MGEEMDETRVRFLRCVYCGKAGANGKTVSNSVGMFRVKQLYNNVLIFECRMCRKVFRRQTVGATLQWADLSPEEKKAFKDRSFKAYTKSKREVK